MQRYAGIFIMALLACTASLAQAQSPNVTGATTPELVAAIRASLRDRYYKGCKNIAVLEVLEVSPASMRGKKPLAVGDKWSEKWRIDACGDIAVHLIEIEIVTKEGATAVALEVKPADEGAPGMRVDFAGLKWKLDRQQTSKAGVFREYVTGGESVEKWTRLFTVTAVKATVSLPVVLDSMQKKFLSEGCLSAGFRVLSRQEAEVTFVRDYSKCRQPTQEFNVVRMVSGTGQYHSLMYGARAQADDAELKRIGDALMKISTKDLK